MKRIIAALLTLILAVGVLVGCDDNKEIDLSPFEACYALSNPDKIVVVSVQAFDTMALENKTTITKGKIGDVDAAVMTVKGEQMRSVEDGSGQIVYGPVEEIDVTKWYRSDMGVSEDLGETWDAEAPSFAPAQGEIAIDLDIANLSDVVVDGNKLTFVVKAENTIKVFGADADIASDVSVEILTDGAVVTNVSMSWVIPYNGETGVERTTVTVNAVYYYDLQQIDM